MKLHPFKMNRLVNFAGYMYSVKFQDICTVKFQDIFIILQNTFLLFAVSPSLIQGPRQLLICWKMFLKEEPLMSQIQSVSAFVKGCLSTSMKGLELQQWALKPRFECLALTSGNMFKCLLFTKLGY